MQRKIYNSRFSNPSSYHPMLFQNPGLPNGNTELHVAMHDYGKKKASISVIYDLIMKHGLGAVAAMSLITNDRGKRPIDILEEYRDKVSIKALYDQLFELMQRGLIKEIDQPLKFSELESNDKTNERLESNLKLALNIANEVRKIIKDSRTHPQYNNYSTEKKILVQSAVWKMRNDVDYHPKSTDKAENIAQYATKTHVGNCLEFSYLAFDLLRKKDPFVRAEVMSIINGDHVFLVLDRKRSNRVNKLNEWGNTAVICDAWAGDVYPAEQLPYKLKDFCTNNGLNFLVTFNPRYHDLTIECKSPSPPRGNKREREETEVDNEPPVKRARSSSSAGR